MLHCLVNRANSLYFNEKRPPPLQFIKKTNALFFHAPPRPAPTESGSNSTIPPYILTRLFGQKNGKKKEGCRFFLEF